GYEHRNFIEKIEGRTKIIANFFYSGVAHHQRHEAGPAERREATERRVLLRQLGLVILLLCAGLQRLRAEIIRRVDRGLRRLRNRLRRGLRRRVQERTQERNRLLLLRLRHAEQG